MNENWQQLPAYSHRETGIAELDGCSTTDCNFRLLTNVRKIPADMSNFISNNKNNNSKYSYIVPYIWTPRGA